MSGNTFGKLFTVTSFGESHGLGLGAIIDGCPPGLELSEADLQIDLDRRRPGTSRYTTARREADVVKILSGVFDGKTTGTPIGLMIENTDQRSKDYGNIAQSFRPGHADYTYWQKYGLRDYRGGGRSSARETDMLVAAGAVAKKYLADYEKTFKMKPPSIWAVVNADGLRAIIHGVEQTKSFDTKKISDFLHTLKDYEGITGPVTFRDDGERIGATFMVYNIQKDGSYKVIK